MRISDWSSDVCSSDLPTHVEVRANGIRQYPTEWVNSARLRLGSPPGAGSFVTLTRNTPIEQQLVKFTDGAILTQEDLNAAVQQIGRASCRERACQYV